MKLIFLILFNILFLTLSSQDRVFPKERLLNKDIKKHFNVINYHYKLNSNSNDLILYSLYGNDSLIGYMYTSRVNSCRTGGCSINKTNNNNNNGNYEYFEYYILFNKNKDIENVRVFNYQATHGQEISSKNWLKQFRGYNVNKGIKVGKDIDAISGATISVYAITSDIENICKRIQDVKPQ